MKSFEADNLTVHPLLLEDDKLQVWCAAISNSEGKFILVDCGGPWQFDILMKKLEDCKLNPDLLAAVIATHHDYDHVGNLAELSDRFHPDIICTETEAPYLKKEKKSLHLMRMEKEYAQSKNAVAKSEIEIITAMRPANPTYTFAEETELPGNPNIILVPTPGHTPGHCSVYVKPSKTLITGDALLCIDGMLYGSNPIYTHDMEAAKLSAKKLSQLSTNTVICAHGGIFSGNIQNTFIKQFD